MTTHRLHTAVLATLLLIVTSGEMAQAQLDQVFNTVFQTILTERLILSPGTHANHYVQCRGPGGEPAGPVTEWPYRQQYFIVSPQFYDAGAHFRFLGGATRQCAGGSRADLCGQGDYDRKRKDQYRIHCHFS